MEKLNGELQSALQRTELRKFSTIVKMTVYLLCYFLENYEASKRVVQEFGLLSIENKNKICARKPCSAYSHTDLQLIVSQ